MRIEFFKGNTTRNKPQWYWRLVARNGKTIADGAEGYARQANCRRACKRFLSFLKTEIPIREAS